MQSTSVSTFRVAEVKVGAPKNGGSWYVSLPIEGRVQNYADLLVARSESRRGQRTAMGHLKNNTKNGRFRDDNETMVQTSLNNELLIPCPNQNALIYAN
jgi:hypothetical protein